MDNLMSQSSFSRTNYNNLKAGAYFTPPEMMSSIANLFKLTTEKIQILEPSCGDMSALLAFLKAGGWEEKAEVYGVELNAETVTDARQKLADREVKGTVINADFLHGTYTSKCFAPLCVSNPPYGDSLDGDRQETLFMKKSYQMISKGGIYVLIIPSYTLASNKFLKEYLVRFDLLGVYRFDDRFYEQFKQVVVVGKRKSTIETPSSFDDVWTVRYKEQIERCMRVEEMPYLPYEPLPDEELIPLSGIELNTLRFAAKQFDTAEAGKALVESPIYEFFDKVSRRPDYQAMKVGKPVTELSPSFVYLAAACGVRQGVIGEGEDSHVMRGYCRVSQREETRAGKDGTSETVITQSTRVEMHVLDGCGNYKVLT